MGAPLNGLATQDLMEVLMVSRSALECNTVDELIGELLRHLEGIFKTGNSNFFFGRHLSHELNLDRVITRNIDDRFIRQFREYYHRLDPFIRVLPLPGTTVLATDQVISFKDLIRSEYYNDFLRPQAIHFQMSIFLEGKGRLLGILSLFRPKNATHFSSLDRAKAELMAPYLAGALEKVMISHKMIERKSFIDSIVSCLPYKGVMVMDTSFDPVYQDENAIRIMSKLNRTGKFGRASPEPLPREIYLRCKDLLSSARKGETLEPCQHHIDLVLPGERHKVSIQLRLITRRGQSPLLLLCLNPREDLARFFERSNEHGLTGREIEVVSLLSKGHTNKQIGKELFISEYTVENHLRSIYRKMGVKNRTSLVHRLIQLTAIENRLTDSPFPS